jgi:hypothetical protein
MLERGIQSAVLSIFFGDEAGKVGVPLLTRGGLPNEICRTMFVKNVSLIVRSEL